MEKHNAKVIIFARKPEGKPGSFLEDIDERDNKLKGRINSFKLELQRE